VQMRFARCMHARREVKGVALLPGVAKNALSGWLPMFLKHKLGPCRSKDRKDLPGAQGTPEEGVGFFCDLARESASFFEDADAAAAPLPREVGLVGC